MCKGEFSNPSQEYFSRRIQEREESNRIIVLLEDEGSISKCTLYYRSCIQKEYTESNVVSCVFEDFCNPLRAGVCVTVCQMLHFASS